VYRGSLEAGKLNHILAFWQQQEQAASQAPMPLPQTPTGIYPASPGTPFCCCCFCCLDSVYSAGVQDDLTLSPCAVLVNNVSSHQLWAPAGPRYHQQLLLQRSARTGVTLLRRPNWRALLPHAGRSAMDLCQPWRKRIGMQLLLLLLRC